MIETSCTDKSGKTTGDDTYADPVHSAHFTLNTWNSMKHPPVTYHELRLPATTNLGHSSTLAPHQRPPTYHPNHRLHRYYPLQETTRNMVHAPSKTLGFHGSPLAMHTRWDSACRQRWILLSPGTSWLLCMETINTLPYSMDQSWRNSTRSPRTTKCIQK